ncbi:MAG: response regulator transcription factor [Burkholderiaceae bacterium]
MTRVGIVDDHPVLCAGLSRFLSDHDDFRVVACCTSAREALDFVRDDAVDVLVLDVAMPGQSGIDALRAIRLRSSRLAVLIYSSFPSEHYALPLLRLGADGYLNKGCEPQEVVAAIRHVASGKRYVNADQAEQLAADLSSGDHGPLHSQLNAREFEIFLGLAKGQCLAELSRSMALSVKSVSTYRMRVLEKLGLLTNSQLTYYAVKNRLLD